MRAEGHPVDNMDSHDLDEVIISTTAQKEVEELGQSFLNGLNDLTLVGGENEDSEGEEMSGDEGADGAEFHNMGKGKAADKFAWVGLFPVLSINTD